MESHKYLATFRKKPTLLGVEHYISMQMEEVSSFETMGNILYRHRLERMKILKSDSEYL